MSPVRRLTCGPSRLAWWSVVLCVSVNLDVIPPAVAKDPTLMRSREVECPKCQHHEAVLIQSTQNVKSNRLTLIFVCCSPTCHHKWTDA